MNVKTSATMHTRHEPPLEEKLASVTAFLQDQNGREVSVIQLPPQSFAEVLVIAGATSRRHAQGLADGIGRLCHDSGYEFSGMEGYENAEWILVDCNEMVINIFLEETRALYRLEELWSGGARQKETRP